MLKTQAATLPVRDKAVARYADKFGTVLEYVPGLSVQPYIKKYRLGNDARGVYFRGEWAKRPAFAEYELTVYSAQNKIVEILRVKEKFNGGVYTRVTRLPDNADYVMLRMVCVDDMPILPERRKFQLRYVSWLAALCFCLALTTDFLIWLCVTFLLRLFDGFTMSLRLSVETWTTILGIAAVVVVLLTCIFSIGGFLMRQRGNIHES